MLFLRQVFNQKIVQICPVWMRKMFSVCLDYHIQYVSLRLRRSLSISVGLRQVLNQKSAKYAPSPDEEKFSFTFRLFVFVFVFHCRSLKHTEYFLN